MKKLTILLVCLFVLSLPSAHAQSTVVVGQGIMPSGSTLPTTCAPTKASDPDSLVLFYHTTSSGGAIGLYQCTAMNTWSAAGGGSGTVTSVSGTTNQIDVATGTTTPVISLDAAVVFPGTWSMATAGAASTSPVTLSGTPFVGTGTTSTPLVYLNGGNAPTTWNASASGGTYYGVNAISGFAGNFVDFHVNGAGSVFAVSSTGTATSAGQFCIPSECIANASGTLQLQNTAGSNFVALKNGPTHTITDSGPFGSTEVIGASACETSFGTTTLATGTTTTQTGLSCLPANSIIDGVVARVTTTITGSCTGWELGDGTTAARFTTNNTNLTSGSTAVPLSGSAWSTGIATASTGMTQASATKITITCAGGNPAAGAIRVIVYYHQPNNPTS